MNGNPFVACLLTIVCGLHISQASAEARSLNVTEGGPVNVIFDTDMWGDIDDPLALAMLHALHDRHEVNLLAVTISTDDPWCAPYVDLIDAFYGHPLVPVGIVQNGMTLENFRNRFPQTTWPDTRYTELITERKNKDGSLVYPRRLMRKDPAPEAVSLLRKTLAAQPDASVVLIQVGYSTNLARLLDTRADDLSPLNGPDLIRSKVRLLSIMARNFRGVEGASEFNLLVDVPAAQRLFANWPTPIVASGPRLVGRCCIPPQASTTTSHMQSITRSPIPIEPTWMSTKPP